MISDKHSINHLVRICELKGIKDIVFSPGSRNAALILAFNQSDVIQCHIVPDERVAAFVALGMSIQSGVATVICCTSGTAALNYAPAIAEAYYQGVPLIVLTADRPVEWIDQGIGQSMRQQNLYVNYIKGSYQYLQEAKDENAIWYNDRILNEAINKSYALQSGPVHINIPFAEPLYNRIEPPEEVSLNLFDEIQISHSLSGKDLDSLLDIWRTSKRKIILLGQLQKDDALEQALNTFIRRDDIILLSETCSNLNINNHIECIDRVITTFEGNEDKIRPDLLISIGGPVISKKIKRLFQNNKPTHHWYVNPSESQDTYQSLSLHLKISGLQFLHHLSPVSSPNNDDFQSIWKERNHTLKIRHQKFLNQCIFSDLKVFDIVLSHLPENACVHTSNSTSVRYLQLFDRNETALYQANRGVSGIDGCTSTALGYALKSDRLNVLISGDIAFFYDSNAFWQKAKPANLKIIVINNGGGGIFRIIDGPSTTDQLEEFFEARHKTNARHLAAMHDLDYMSINDIDSLESNVIRFFEKTSETISILEIFTPPAINDQVLKDYFYFLKNGQ